MALSLPTRPRLHSPKSIHYLESKRHIFSLPHTTATSSSRNQTLTKLHHFSSSLSHWSIPVGPHKYPKINLIKTSRQVSIVNRPPSSSSIQSLLITHNIMHFIHVFCSSFLANNQSLVVLQKRHLSCHGGVCPMRGAFEALACVLGVERCKCIR